MGCLASQVPRIRHPKEGCEMTEAKTVRERDWRFRTSQRVQTCTFCGRSIVARELFYRDVVSGHLNAHRSCLNESKKP